jgi:pimeloyl-ACP methyl ester carboxylesterase
VTDFGGSTDAPAVVCVHGVGGSSVGWTPLGDALAASHRVVGVDLPGHGLTPRGDRPVSVRRAAAVLTAAVEHLGLGPVTLVGHSMGGVVSVLTAARAPALVERLLLLAPPLPWSVVPGVRAALLPYVTMCLWPRAGRFVLDRRLARRTIEEHVEDRLRLTCAGVCDFPDLTQMMASELRLAYQRGEDPVRCFLEAARSVGIFVTQGRDYRAAITEVTAPVDVVCGGLDPLVRPGALGVLGRLRPQWRTELWPRVGHSPHLEAPTAVAGLLARSAPALPVPAAVGGAPHGGRARRALEESA